jgi:hypothetical protein
LPAAGRGPREHGSHGCPSGRTHRYDRAVADGVKAGADEADAEVLHGGSEERDVASAVGLAGHVEHDALELAEVLEKDERERGGVEHGLFYPARSERMRTTSSPWSAYENPTPTRGTRVRGPRARAHGRRPGSEDTRQRAQRVG